MSVFRFPFNWGSDVPSVVTAPVVVVPPRWTTVGATAKGWIETGAQRHRFERIYTQPVSVFGQSVNFVYEVRDQFPFVLSDDAQVLVASTITNP